MSLFSFHLLQYHNVCYTFPMTCISDTNFVLANYKTETCKKPPRLCRQGYACPHFHNARDRRRSPKLAKYRWAWSWSSSATTVLSSVILHIRTLGNWLAKYRFHEYVWGRGDQFSSNVITFYNKILFNLNDVLLGFSYLKKKPTHMFWIVNQTSDIKCNLIG